jgi:hypothetical protein
MKQFWNILNILKIPGIVVSCVVSLYAVFSFALKPLKEDVMDTKEMVETMRVLTDSTFNITLQNQQRSIKNEAALKANSEQVNILRNSYLEYIQNDDRLTKEDFKKYMDPFMEYFMQLEPAVLEQKNSSEQEPVNGPKQRRVGEVVFIPLDTLN